MKKLFFSLLFLCNFLFAQNASISPKVDERIELLSTVFRLAEANEYVTRDLVYYTEEVDDYFYEYKDHPVVKYAQEVRISRGVAYDAVMSFATNINIDDNIYFVKDLTDNSLDSRWTKENAATFLSYLNDFYKTSRFHDFFSSYSEFYQKAEENFSHILNMVDFSWFENFYGIKAPGTYSLIISMLNGPSSYGSTIEFINGDKHIYAIIGTWQTDSAGYPAYSQNILSTVIHEYNHSFCNPLIHKHYKKMQKNAEKSYSEVASKMSIQAYDNARTMLCEMLVRACVIRYQIKDNENRDLRKNWFCAMEKAQGFLWIDQLVDLLDEYENNRNKYVTLDDFMPKIVKLSNSVNMKKLKQEYDKKTPKILGTNIVNNATDVDPTLTEITVKFDQPMHTGARGASYGTKGQQFFPKMDTEKTPLWSETNKELTFYVSLEPDTEYSMSFPGMFFMNESFQYAEGIYYLDFKTSKE